MKDIRGMESQRIRHGRMRVSCQFFTVIDSRTATLVRARSLPDDQLLPLSSRQKVLIF